MPNAQTPPNEKWKSMVAPEWSSLNSAYENKLRIRHLTQNHELQSIR